MKLCTVCDIVPPPDETITHTCEHIVFGKYCFKNGRLVKILHCQKKIFLQALI